MNQLISIVILISVLSIGCCWAAEENLVGYWRFDKEGDQVLDLSGKGHSAKLTGGKLVTENEKRVLELHGSEQIVVPSSPDLNLKKSFTLEAVVKPTDLSDGRYIVFKDSEYLLRVDWPKEGSKISFFVYADNKWEPRVSAYTPSLGTWYHIFGVWNGSELLLWVNGEPFHAMRGGRLPRLTNNPVFIGAFGPNGHGLVGTIEYVKIYNKALRPFEVIRKTYNLEVEAPAEPLQPALFDFAKGLQGWVGREGASVSVFDSKLTVKTQHPRSFIIANTLNADVDKCDFLSLRMSVDKGSQADLIFATTKGAGRIPFQTVADGKMHTYIFEPWTWIGWGGNLIALGLAPSEVENCTAALEYLRVTEQLEAEPQPVLDRLFTDSTLPRAERAETLIARIKNVGGPASNLTAVLAVPEGVTLKGPASQTLAALGYLEEKDLSWEVAAERPLAAEFKVTLAVPGVSPASLSKTVLFSANPRLPKAAYVPEPVPAQTGKYTIWTHYCPLWKTGTHYGWQRIEPWPERKPVLGWYNEGTPEVADWHIKYWLEHGISAVVYCWYRTSVNAPVTVQNIHIGHAIHDGLLKAKYLPRIKFAIMWENGCGKGCGSAKDLMENVLPFWIENYFSNPSYLRVDGKPLLYVWVPNNVTRHLGGSDTVRKTFDDMRLECAKLGLGGLYIVGCVGRQDKELLAQMAKEGWDASSAYGNNWKQPTEIIRRVGDNVCAPYEGFVEQQEALWKFKRDLHLLPDITAAMMGWDSRPWKETAFFWSDNTPETFRDLCLRAKAIMDAKTTSAPEKNTIVFCCWNEFGEGHYIEPTRGYGFSYVDVIRDVFSDGPKEHLDIAPEDVGLGPCDSWYQEVRRATPESGPSLDTAWSGEKLAAWQGMMGLDKIEVKDGILRAVSVTNDPAFASPALKIRANRFSKVIVDMKVSAPGGAQLFWSTSAIPRTSEGASVKAPTVGDGQFHAYTFEVGKNDYWGGCLTHLRLDPAVAEGVTVEIRSIRLE